MAGTGPARTDGAEKSTRRNCHGRTTHHRHARPCAGHPRPCSRRRRTWMAGTGPAMTDSAEKSTRRNCHGRTTTLSPSCPALCRASTSLLEAEKNVDGRDRPGHDGECGKIDANNCHGRTTPSPSCPALCRVSTSLLAAEKNVDGRDRPGHDG